MNHEIKTYELSLWDDVPASQSKNKEQMLEPTEIRRCIIASHTMSSPARAYDITLNRKVNGENTLTFSVNARYFDEELEEYVTNPYLKFLSNERKVKLWYIKNGKKVWYDFIIKNVTEDSQKATFTYTAKDQHIQELAKSGFNLIFDKELKNNTDTAEAIAEAVLQGTDWEVDKTSQPLLEYTDEPVYKATVKNQIVITNMLNQEENIILEPGTLVYIPYSVVQDKGQFYQVLYSKISFADDNLPKDENGVLLQEYFGNYYFSAEYEDLNFPTDLNNNGLLLNCRGARLVRIPKTIYDDKLERYLSVYEKDGNTYYGFTETEYQTPELVQSLITNGSKFSSVTGWGATNINGIKTERELFVWPPVSTWPDEKDNWTEDGQIKNLATYIAVKPPVGGQATIFNHGFFDNRIKTKGLSIGQEFQVVIKAKTEKEHQAVPCNVKVCDYDIDGKYYIEKQDGRVYFEGTLLTEAENGGYCGTLSSKLEISESELRKSKIGIFISFGEPGADGFVPLTGTVLIEKAEFFPKILNEDKEIIYPDAEIFAGKEEDVKKLLKTHWYYFNPFDEEGNLIEYKDQTDISFSYTGYEPDLSYKQVYFEDCQKRRTITEKESNRFNILQKICEVFECWLKFNIIRDENGAIVSRKVRFQEYVGKKNYSGFKYGINLNSIKRTLDSNKIVTKLIVKNNSNEFGKNGFCSIARAPSNPSGTNVVYNFDYYISQNLLSKNEVDYDLYNIDDGLYPKLSERTKKYNTLTEELIAISENIVSLNATIAVEEARLDAAKADGIQSREDLQELTGFTFEQFAGIDTVDDDKKQNFKNWQKDKNIVPHITKIFTLEMIKQDAETKVETSKESLETFEKAEAELELQQTQTLEEINNIEEAFYKRYSRFIQEGSWIDEDYTDDELYYLDSLSTLYTSAKPQVSYTIDVFDLSHVEDYENYDFDIGDKSFVEDPEFFGWEYEGSYLKKPKREEVIISEVTSGIDNPAKNNLKIQNYKTQFDDLFQRIAAATESLQYNTGRYERFTNAVETDGTLSYAALQETVNQNGLTIANAGAQTVSCDERGIITTDRDVTSKQVRMIGGGIFMTTDGGETWKTGLTGDGINASVITTGQLNAGEVNIMTGNAPSHKWDGKGITAYKTSYNIDSGAISSVDNSNFVRMDEFGIYGIQNNANFDARVFENGQHGIAKIQANSIFSLTQEGVTIGQGESGLVGTSNKLTIGGDNGFSATAAGIMIGGISGLIATPERLTIGGENGLIAASDGLTIGNYFEVKDGVLSISGWKISDGFFSNDSETMWMAANGHSKGTGDKYVFYANDRFKVDIDGKMYASRGEIGGLIIEEDRIQSSAVRSNITYTAQMVKLGEGALPSEGGAFSVKVITEGQEDKPDWPFFVTYDGTLYSKKGTIGGMSISYKDLYSTAAPIKESNKNVTYTARIQRFENDANSRSAFLIERKVEGENNPTYPFWVKYDGSLRATKGTIGGWTIGESNLESTTYGQIGLYSTYNGEDLSIAGSGAKNDWRIIAGGNKFGVDKDGNLYAQSAHLQSAIEANGEVKFNGWDMNDKRIQYADVIIPSSGSAPHTYTAYMQRPGASDDGKSYAAFAIKDQPYNGAASWPFFVRYDGTLYAKKIYMDIYEFYVENGYVKARTGSP